MKLQSGVQYMGMEVVSCSNLPSTDENGYTDAFVVLEWERMEQKTKVVEKNLNPVFKEKLYFPLLLFKFSAEEIAKKENFVQIKVYDFDPDGSCDVLGFAEFGLHEITLQKESEIDGQFARHLEKTISIEKCRSKSATITIRAWFQPRECPSAIAAVALLVRLCEQIHWRTRMTRRSSCWLPRRRARRT